MADSGRSFTRISFEHTADLIIDGKVFPTKIIDLSMRGMLIQNPENSNLSLNDDCEVIMHPADSSQDELEFMVKATHIKDDSVGMVITETDIDSFTSILDIISATDGDSEKIQDEITSSIE